MKQTPLSRTLSSDFKGMKGFGTVIDESRKIAMCVCVLGISQSRGGPN